MSGQKLIENAKNGPPKACGQTVLPDWSVLIGQKLVENAKIKTFQWDILGDFQTMWKCNNCIWVLEWIHLLMENQIPLEGRFPQRKCTEYTKSVSQF